MSPLSTQRPCCCNTGRWFRQFWHMDAFLFGASLYCVLRDTWELSCTMAGACGRVAYLAMMAFVLPCVRIGLGFQDENFQRLLLAFYMQYWHA